MSNWCSRPFLITLPPEFSEIFDCPQVARITCLTGVVSHVQLPLSPAFGEILERPQVALVTCLTPYMFNPPSA